MTYCYTTSKGETVDRRFAMGKAPERVRLDDGRIAYRDIAAEHNGRPKGQAADPWPLHSTSMGVLPNQVPQFKKWYAERGVQVEYDNRGRLKFENRQHRNRCMALRNMSDADAGYGDRCEITE